jgi:hypothetical protein
MKILTITPADIMPLFFGIVIGAFNYKNYRYKIYFNQTVQAILISIIISYAGFYFTMFSSVLIAYFLDCLYLIDLLPSMLGKSSRFSLSICLAMNLVAPLSLLFAYKRVFSAPKGNTKKGVVTAVLTTILTVLLIYFYYNKNSLIVVLWITLVPLYLQLVIYQKEIRLNFKK